MNRKTILITGSSRGIGKAVAELAHAQGFNVIVHGKTDSEELNKTHTGIEGSFKIFCDVADKEAVNSEVKKLIDKFKTIDVLVNSAGVVRPKPFLEYEGEDIIDEFSINLLGPVYFCQAVIPAMKENEYGRIVNISSIRGIPSLTSERGLSYSMSKAAVISLTSGLSKELAPYITVNSVAPGFTETEMAKTWNDKVWKQAREGSLMGRPAKPTEIASAVMYLGSEEAGFITGQTILVDGGYEGGGK